MHHPDALDCPFRDVVLEAVRELEETKIKFSDAIEQVRHCESKLNNALNVMLKCKQLMGTNFHQLHWNGTVKSNNEAINNALSLHETGQRECPETIPQTIKTEPPDLHESDDFVVSETFNSTPLPSRKRSSIWDSITSDGQIKEEPSKRCRNNSSSLQDDEVVLDVSKTEPVHETEVVKGRVVPVVNSNPQDDIFAESREDPDLVINKSPELVTDHLFSQLSGTISQKTLDAVKALGFSRMTEVQSQVIQPMLNRENMLVLSRRGSGKTLALLIPAIEMLCRANFRPCDGTGCVIICLTNELVIQTYGVLMGLMQYHQLTYGMLLQSKAGRTRAFPSESVVTSEGVNILVTTPSKLLECVCSRSGYVCKLQCLIVDDSDFVLYYNVKSMEKIFGSLPSHSQIALFTANEISCSPKLDKLLGPGASYVSVRRNKEKCLISEGTKHYYVCCGAASVTLLMYNILKEWHDKEKVVVVFREAFSVNYFRHLLHALDIPVYAISERYGNEAQRNTFLSFCSAKTGVLLCYSLLNVGLDIPAVSWVVHFDCSSIEDYICSVGLTARGLNDQGKSLILLYPIQKEPFLHVFQKHCIPVQELTSMNFKTRSTNFQEKLQVLVKNGGTTLRKLASRTAGACARAVGTPLSQKTLLNIAKCFGLTAVPASWTFPKEKSKHKKQIYKMKNLSNNKKQNKLQRTFRGTARHLHQ